MKFAQAVEKTVKMRVITKDYLETKVWGGGGRSKVM